MPDQTYHRYEVVEVWGDVPEQVSALVGTPESYLLEPEFRGDEYQQNFHRLGEGTIGGWYCEHRGTMEVKRG